MVCEVPTGTRGKSAFAFRRYCVMVSIICGSSLPMRMAVMLPRAAASLTNCWVVALNPVRMAIEQKEAQHEIQTSVFGELSHIHDAAAYCG